MGIDIDVRLHRPAELGTLVAVASRSFWDDPLFNYFQPDFLAQHRSVGFFQATVEDCARHGRLYAAVHQDMPVGVAAWLPPGVPIPTGGRRALAQARRAMPVIARSPRRRQAMALLAEMPKHHLHDEHWYLALLAADPRMQGKGVGTALLTPVLAQADAEGLPVYLETQKETNLAYYRRFGFELSSTIEVPDTPTVWTMTRAAR